MNKCSIIIEKLFKKYKLNFKMKINYKELININQREKIEINDLISILGISRDSYRKLTKGITKFAYIKDNRLEQVVYNEKIQSVINLEKITKEEILIIKEKYNMQNYEIRKTLGLSKYVYKKLQKEETYIARVDDIKIKRKVELLKMDFRYIKKYGNRYYTIKELLEKCKERNIEIMQFARYINKSPRYFKFTKMILENNKKIWIGDNIQLSTNFLEKNYSKLQSICERKAKCISMKISSNQYTEDFVGVAIDKIVFESGAVEKNFKFDKKLMFNIFGAKAKYAMYNWYYNICKGKSGIRNPDEYLSKSR